LSWRFEERPRQRGRSFAFSPLESEREKRRDFRQFSSPRGYFSILRRASKRFGLGKQGSASILH
jgi:hypothetical protein